MEPVPPPLEEIASGAIAEPVRPRGVLRSNPAFRRLWAVLTLRSLGDWLGLLATTSLAAELVPGAAGSSYAIGGVLAVRLLPALLLGPFAGAVADRFDRRLTLVVCDLLRFALFVSIPIVRTVPYLLVASFLIEAIGLFWVSAKEAAVPNLVSRDDLERANQYSLISTYGSAPIAAAIFAVLATFSRLLAELLRLDFLDENPIDLALHFNALTFLLSAAVVLPMREVGERAAPREGAEKTTLFGEIADGWRYIGSTTLIRGLIVGICGAFAAGGAVIALGRQFVAVLGGGASAFGLLFGAVFTGLAFGMFFGPKLFRDFSRRRLFGLSIVGAGAALALMALLANLVLALFATLGIGLFAGVAWIVGQTLLGLEVADDVRGRTFAAVQSLIRVELLFVLSVAPFLSGGLTDLLADRSLSIGEVVIRPDGSRVTLFAAGLLAVFVGWLSYRQMVVPGMPPLWREIEANLPGRWRRPLRTYDGFFVVFEGGEGAGKSTQVKLLAERLREEGYEVVTTLEPGATAAGARIRKALLDKGNVGLSPRAEALLYAADRAQHVAEVVRPALERGAVVISDRYADSSLAYQSGGRELDRGEIARLSAWATDDLEPDVVVLLDVAPEIGLSRIGEADRIESESLEFHRRVRGVFLDLAEERAGRFFLADASEPTEDVHALVAAEVLGRLAGRVTARERVST